MHDGGAADYFDGDNDGAVNGPSVPEGQGLDSYQLPVSSCEPFLTTSMRCVPIDATFSPCCPHRRQRVRMLISKASNP
jgi:hypothetical protein